MLGLPLDEVGRYDDFFAHGGGSLAGVRLIIETRRVDLAGGPDEPPCPRRPGRGRGRRRRRGPRPAAGTRRAARCRCRAGVPALRGGQCAQLRGRRPRAVGHLARRRVRRRVRRATTSPAPTTPSSPWTSLARRLAREVQDRIDVPVSLWGHGAGAALALEVTRVLRLSGRAPAHVVLAVGTGDAVAAGVDAGSWLRDAGALTDVDQSRSERGALIERAFHHDLEQAASYRLPGEPGVPVTLVPLPRAPGEPDVVEEWAAALPDARTVTLPGAGRYLLRSHAAEVAELVREVVGVPEGEWGPLSLTGRLTATPADFVTREFLEPQPAARVWTTCCPGTS
ncbi:thioesterase domain-containing protein [Nocardioides convexus]|uniref:alpha/beta fold hydrolase n=1 Tax=Nocardioides convexus TaxID=2712224 RepID=UPI00241817E0|nr:thioesterase domain-containing protein [Nocardioides convexus]